MPFPNHRLLAAAAILLTATACADRTLDPADDFDPAFSAGGGPVLDELLIQQKLDEINGTLAASGAAFRVANVELSLAPNADPASPTFVFASDHTLRLASRWVPADPRRNAAGTDITYANFFGFLTANGAGPVEASLDAGFNTWNAVQCSNLGLQKVALAGNNFPSLILTLGGFVNDFLAADIATIGFLPGFIFDAVLGPGASTSVLGVTFGFIWVDGGTGVPTDIDGNHLADSAAKEIWYNNAFSWTTGGGPGIDVESVALHEEGHALELGHFGRVALNLKTGKLTVSPRAVMNAFILGVLRTPLGTDNSAYCGNWASWPS